MMTPLFLSLIMQAQAGTKASSTKDNNPAAAAVDGLLHTTWMEDASGYGSGEWLEVDLSKQTQINQLSIWPGNLSEGAKSYKQYSRPKVIRIEVDGVQVGDAIRLLDKPRRIDVPLDTSGRKIRIVVDEVFEGVVYADLAITEISVNFPDNSMAQRVERWASSKDGLRQQEKFTSTLDELYKRCKQAEFGDKEAFAVIGDAAADGAPYYRKKVQSMVPDGYRIQAIPSDQEAQKALRKLKNPNAIPYLEQASLRSYGKEKKLIQEDVEYFYAYSDLLGGPNRNVRFWGEAGWAAGELQSFGEPMGMEFNRYAELFVADIGNNRIQLYNDEGRSIVQWGDKEPSITNKWYTQGRDWYVSGSTPGTKANQFVNPVDVVIIPDKEGDGFATLDANGRVQIFDLEGRPVISWTAAPSYAPEPKLGGTAYLAYLPKRKILCTILQDEGICFNQEAEELNRWSIQDGTPNAVEVLPNDKILMAFGDQVVSFAYDGFRDRVIIDSSILGDGFESVDLTLDNKNKLWVVTDRGVAFKFKRPGKLDYQIQAIDRPLTYPRIAVIDEMLHILSDDQIEVIDIKQRKIDLADKEE